MSNDNNIANTKLNNELSKKDKVLNIVGIVLCVILLPILIFNCVLIVKGIANPDQVPSIGNKIPLIVVSQSMDPTIKKNDFIVCQKVDIDDIKVGDVISFFDPTPNASENSVVTHRVVSIDVDKWTGEKSFWTKGDNKINSLDGFPVPEENIIGVWTEFRIGVIGSVILFSQSVWGLIVFIGIPVGFIVFYEIIRRRKKDNQSKEDIDSLKAELEALKKEKANQSDLTENEQESQEKVEDKEKPTEADET